jgi:RNA polymerase sigma-70 factor (ECF subfamily)
MMASLDEPQAFGEIFDRHAPRIHRYLASRVGVAAAEDLVSEVFVTAFRSRRAYAAAYSDASPWLLGFAANAVRHHRSSEGRRWAIVGRLKQYSTQRKDDVIEDFTADVLARDQVEAPRRALGALDEKYRDVLILYSALDLSYAEVADVLSLRIGTVRSRLSRGRAQLRELLAASGQYTADDKQRGASPSTARSSSDDR